MRNRLKDLVLAYLDKHPRCMGEYVFESSFRGGREPPPEWKPEKAGASTFMRSPCRTLDSDSRTELVTHYSGPEGDMCCDQCAEFVRMLLGPDRAPREAEWAPALRAMTDEVGWQAKR